MSQEKRGQPYLKLLLRWLSRLARAAAFLFKYSWFRELTAAITAALLIITFLYQPVKVEGTSMAPALLDQERVLINKFIYRSEPIARGDIIVFHYPRDPSKSFIKRVVGLPGETVEIRAGRVYINGAELPEPYSPESSGDVVSHGPVKVAPEHYYVLGDHRATSNDSRTWGPVHRRYIYGKAVYTYWPLERTGSIAEGKGE